MKRKYSFTGLAYFYALLWAMMLGLLFTLLVYGFIPEIKTVLFPYIVMISTLTFFVFFSAIVYSFTESQGG